MRLIKLGVISFAVFFLLLTGISLLMPSTILVSKSISINAPKDSIFSILNDLKRWKEWSANMENANPQYSGNTIGKGATVSVDKTTIIIDSSAAEYVSATWQTSGNLLTGSFNFLPSKNENVTALQWQIVNHVKWYPQEKFAAIFSDKAIGSFMEKSLDKLKSVAEHTPVVFTPAN